MKLAVEKNKELDMRFRALIKRLRKTTNVPIELTIDLHGFVAMQKKANLYREKISVLEKNIAVMKKRLNKKYKLEA